MRADLWAASSCRLLDAAVCPLLPSLFHKPGGSYFLPSTIFILEITHCPGQPHSTASLWLPSPQIVCSSTGCQICFGEGPCWVLCSCLLKFSVLCLVSFNKIINGFKTSINFSTRSIRLVSCEVWGRCQAELRLFSGTLSPVMCLPFFLLFAPCYPNLLYLSKFWF